MTAFLVDHGEHIKPAYGYKVEYGQRSVVISGDTRYSDNLIKYAKGSDLLLHEVATAPADRRELPQIKTILAHHTSAAEAGRVFAQTRPRLAVFTHLAWSQYSAGEKAAIDDVLREARQAYAGPLEMGEDLMRIVLGETIDVKRFDHQKGSY